MLSNLLKGVDTIYIAYGSTDFRRQISSLCKMVQEEYRMNPYDKVAYQYVSSVLTVGIGNVEIRFFN